ncbi:MAG: hypothetical protein HY904_12185 [Deltaproteobacteria bacterium]|nr:hypothetical protein [Deltaproteobacteria bacterium]
MRPILPPALLLLAAGAAHAQDLRIQCPSGTRAVLESETTVLCKPKTAPAPAEPAPAPAEHVVVQEGPVRTTVVGSGSMELTGLHSVPEVCGLGTLEDDVVEAAKEAVYLAVNHCLEETEAVAPVRPPRWVGFKVEAVSEKSHTVTVPPEAWALPVQTCLLKRPPRLPKLVRGRSFVAYYRIVATPQDKPPPPPCVAQRP